MFRPLLTPPESRFLLFLALFGLIVPNGIFIGYAVACPETFLAALTNPVALVFILEAFALMFLFAWLLAKSGARPGWKGFILLSLIGSMLFSVPLVLRRMFGARD